MQPQKLRRAKGEGSFRTNPDGSITHRKSVGFKPDGTRKVLTVTAASKSACVKEMRKKEDEWNANKNRSKIFAGSTVLELCHKHLNYQVEQDELKPKSIDRRECTIENQIGRYPLGHMQVQAVTVADIDEHIHGLMKNGQLSVSSIKKTVDVLNAAFNWSIRRGDLEKNPVAPIKDELSRKIRKLEQKNEDDADVIVLSPEEIAQFEAEATARCIHRDQPKYPAGLYGLLLLHTGMRCGEMLALTWGDYDERNQLLTINKSRSMAKNRQADGKTKYTNIEGSTKNQKARTIRLTERAADILHQLWIAADCRAPDSLIVSTRSGKPNTATNLEHRIQTIFKNAGMGYLTGSLHIFRRTFATQMYEQGARVKDIAAYIGDLESTTTQYYIAVRKKTMVGDEQKHIVAVPSTPTPSSTTTFYHDQNLKFQRLG